MISPETYGPPVDNAEPHGRYGDCGEDASLGYVNSPEPKLIVRMPARQDAERLAMLIHGTGCTISEHSKIKKDCTIIYGSGDDVVSATRLLELKGYRVAWVKRHTP
jgi:hypothetical protein